MIASRAGVGVAVVVGAAVVVAVALEGIKFAVS